MKIIVSLLGLLTIMVGLWPMVKTSELVPVALGIVPGEGPVYPLMIITVGVLGLLYGLKREHAKVK